MAKKTLRKSEETTSPSEHSAYSPHILLDTSVIFLLSIIAIWAFANFCFLSYQIGNKRIRLNASMTEKTRMINEEMTNYKLRLQYPGGKIKSFPIADAGLSVDMNSSIESLSGKVSSLDRVEWWRPIPIRLALEASRPQLNNFITQNATVLISKPTNATIAVSNGTVSLSSATVGKEYGLVNGSTTIKEQAATLDPKTITLIAIPVDPAITQSHLSDVASKIKRIIAERVTITVGGQTITPTSADISSWLGLTPNQAQKTVDVSVNGAAVNDYINSLASKSSQVERDRVVVRLADGTSTIAVNGQDSSLVTDQQEAGTVIGQDLLQGKDFSVNLPVAITPYETVTAADWPKWIEVNLTTERMYVYQNGQAISTFLVSAGKPSTPTPVGTFYIWEKLSVQTMSGPGYVQPDVPWINYFDHSGDAIHGNYWRPASVFGSTNTSHGCVGLKVGDAEWVYNWAPDGTPVVIHE